MLSIKKILILLIGLSFSSMLLAVEYSVKVKIVPPRSTGGSPITGYWIEAKSKYSDWYKLNPGPWPLLPNVYEYTFTGGFRPEVYEFRVIAVNKCGLSKPSEPDRANFAKADYWEVYLVCEDGKSCPNSLDRSSNSFDINSLFDLSPRKKIQIPYRQ